MKTICFWAILLMVSSRFTSATPPLKVTVAFEKREYRLGDVIQFGISYQNVSEKPLRICAGARYYVSLLLSLVRVKDTTKAEYILPEGESVYDFEELLQYVVRLDPGDTVTRHYKASVESALPDGYAKRHKALYLVFNGSAIQLPGTGTYAVTSEYDESKGDELDEDIQGEPRLWAGKAKSEPILIKFR